jgi:uncharacterized membrane protein
MNKKDYASIGVIIVMLFMAAYFYPNMPDKIAVHWNAAGQADGYASKAIGILALPIITIGIYALFLVIPVIEVFKENLAAFREVYDSIKLFIAVFMLVIYSASILQNIGYKFNMTIVIMPAVAVLFYYLGTVMPKMRRNFFVGIRTPWTLANDEVWAKTHAAGGKTFKVNAIIILVATVISDYGAGIIIASVLLNALFLAVYSYVLYRKQGKNQLK